MAARSIVLLAAALLAVAVVPSAFVQLAGQPVKGPQGPSSAVRSVRSASAAGEAAQDSTSFVSLGLGAAFGFLVAIAGLASPAQAVLENPGFLTPDKRPNESDGYQTYGAAMSNINPEVVNYESPAQSKGLLAELGDRSGPKWEAKDKLFYKGVPVSETNEAKALQEAKQASK